VESYGEEILAFASTDNTAIVTLDSDFHMILAVSGAGRPSVVRLRLQGLQASAVVKVVLDVLSAFEVDLKRGCLITVKSKKITCHRLPIGGSS
jgi:predicted nuclease of predicted toxin-antitoxin system